MIESTHTCAHRHPCTDKSIILDGFDLFFHYLFPSSNLVFFSIIFIFIFLRSFLFFLFLFTFQYTQNQEIELLRFDAVFESDPVVIDMATQNVISKNRINTVTVT